VDQFQESQLLLGWADRTRKPACLHLEGKRKGLGRPNLVGRVPGTRAPRGPITRSRGQRSRSRRLTAFFAKNPHNFAACCRINLIFGRWRKDPLPPCPRCPRCHGNDRSLRLSVLSCKDGPIADGPSTAAPSCWIGGAAHSGNALHSINEVTRRWAELVREWVTVGRQVNNLSM